MARFSSLSRAVPFSAAALIVLGALAAPTGASADYLKLPKCSPNCFGTSPPKQVFLPKFPNKFNYGLGGKVGGPGNKFGGGGYHHGHGGWGYGAAALGGMAVGLVAAGAASANAGAYSQDAAELGDCYLVRRRAVDEDGNVYIRRVRVCE